MEKRLMKTNGQRANTCSIKIVETFTGFKTKNRIRTKNIIVTVAELIKPSRRKITNGAGRPVCTSRTPSKCVEEMKLIAPAKTIKMNPKISRCF